MPSQLSNQTMAAGATPATSCRLEWQAIVSEAAARTEKGRELAAEAASDEELCRLVW